MNSLTAMSDLAYLKDAECDPDEPEEQAAARAELVEIAFRFRDRMDRLRVGPGAAQLGGRAGRTTAETAWRAGERLELVRHQRRCLVDAINFAATDLLAGAPAGTVAVELRNRIERLLGEERHGPRAS
jgi:hypothetical protein